MLVPCVSSSSVTLDLDSGSNEKSTIKTDDHPRSPTPKNDPTPVPTPIPEISVASPILDIPIPPTSPPPHILPLSETEGVTSGAVQPPGSTGDSPVQPDKTCTPDSAVPSSATAEGDESEGTSFTEDEDMDGLDDLEDEEEKLIMDGGAGIPIGPVRSSIIMYG